MLNSRNHATTESPIGIMDWALSQCCCWKNFCSARTCSPVDYLAKRGFRYSRKQAATVEGDLPTPRVNSAGLLPEIRKFQWVLARIFHRFPVLSICSGD